jgi:hypothetical protein
MREFLEGADAEASDRADDVSPHRAEPPIDFANTIVFADDLADALLFNAVHTAPQTIEAHFARMIAETGDASLERELRLVLDEREMISRVIGQKVQQCLADGRGHSLSFMQAPGKPLVSVSCWNCALLELRGRFEAALCPYADALESYLRDATDKGASSFVHIFVCFTQAGVGVTVCFANLQGGRLLTPNELVAPGEIGGW